MSTIVIVTVFLLGWKIFSANIDRQIENYDLSKVDYGKMHKDKTKYFLSSYDVKENIIKGKYDRS